MMRHAIALNGAFFTAQRMLQEYLAKAYDLQSPAGQASPAARPTPVTMMPGTGR